MIQTAGIDRCTEPMVKPRDRYPCLLILDLDHRIRYRAISLLVAHGPWPLELGVPGLITIFLVGSSRGRRRRTTGGTDTAASSSSSESDELSEEEEEEEEEEDDDDDDDDELLDDELDDPEDETEASSLCSFSCCISSVGT